MSKTEITRNSIGIFDSGFGGLNIMRGIVKELPEYDYVYLGDTARVPYGNKTKKDVYEFTKQAVSFLFSKDCGLIILACNTASSDALRKIQQEYLPERFPDKKVLGVIVPTVEHVAWERKSRRVGVIATKRTVESGAFKRELKKADPGIKVFQSACPMLVPLIESGGQNSKVADRMLKKYLKPLLDEGIDTLVLGCTHYGIMENQIKMFVGKNIQVVSEAKIVARKLGDYLKRHPEIEKNLSKDAQYVFYTTDLTDKFIELGSKFFGRKIEPKKINLDDVDKVDVSEMK